MNVNNLLENYIIKEIKGVEPIISYNGNIFLSVEELHQWKVEHMWNGIDIDVSNEYYVKWGDIDDV